MFLNYFCLSKLMNFTLTCVYIRKVMHRLRKYAFCNTKFHFNIVEHVCEIITGHGTCKNRGFLRLHYANNMCIRAHHAAASDWRKVCPSKWCAISFAPRTFYVGMHVALCCVGIKMLRCKRGALCFLSRFLFLVWNVYAGCFDGEW